MAKLVAMLRIKDGIFFVNEWLERMVSLVDEIVVLDNGSTDGTTEILQAHPKVANITRTEGYNEGRDKKIMYDQARMRKPDWLIWLDVDEIFEPELTRADLDRLMSRNYINKYAFRRFHFIDREHFAGSYFRLNYSAGHDRIMWRENASGYFQNLIIDSPNVKGISGLKWYSNIRLKHLGYIDKAIVDKKAELYRTIIPEKEDIFQTMYLQGEKKIKWRDERKHIRVIFLNVLLTALQFTHIISKVKNKLMGIFKIKGKLPSEVK